MSLQVRVSAGSSKQRVGLVEGGYLGGVHMVIIKI